MLPTPDVAVLSEENIVVLCQDNEWDGRGYYAEKETSPPCEHETMETRKRSAPQSKRAIVKISSL
jgi:hypothetical protein